MNRKKANRPAKTRFGKKPKRSPKSRAKSAAHLIRGIVVEGLAIVVLAVIYLTIQSTSANEVLEKGDQRSVGLDTQTKMPFSSSSELNSIPLRSGFVYAPEHGRTNATARPPIGNWR